MKAVDVILLALRLALAAVFLVSATAKFASLTGSRRAAADLGVPTRVAPVVGTLLPFVELAVAIGLVVLSDARVAAVAAAVLLAAFTALVAANLARGRSPVCRCFGDVGRAAPISTATVARNAALLVMALVVAVAGGGDDPLGLLTLGG